MAVALLFLMVIGFLLIGVPIAVSLGLSSIIFLLVHSDSSLGSIAQTLFNAFAGHYTLLAIPLFILAADIMNIGSLADRLLRFCQALVGRFRGGLGHVNVASSLVFSGMSGSAVADAVESAAQRILEELRPPAPA